MYNKLFTKILDSSIWLAPDPTRLVWITLIAAMDEDGNAMFACVDNLAIRARVTIEQAEAAVRAFESPDPKSGDPDNEGRRIERFPGGWHILNAHKYRSMVTKSIIREQTRLRTARWRAKQTVTQSDGGDAHVTQCNENVTPSEAVSRALSEARDKTPRRAARGTPQGEGELTLHESLPKQEWAEWLDFRRKRRWPLDATTLRKQLNVLVSVDTETQKQIIEKSINAGWQGLFPPKGRPATRSRGAPTVAELEISETRRLSSEGRSPTQIAEELVMPVERVQEILRNGHARQ